MISTGMMGPWNYLQANIVGGLAGGFAFIVYGSFVGGPLNPSRDLTLIAILEVLALLLANGLTFWRNTSIRRAEERFKQYQAAREYQVHR